MTDYPLGDIERQAREDLAEVGRRMHALGFAAGADGNLSIRLRDDYILITPSGFSKGFLHPDQMVVVDLDNNLRPSDHPMRQHLRQSSETNMHLEAYRQRADVQGVIHAHPPMGITCTLAGVSLATNALPEVMYHLGAIPTAPYATPGTPEGAVQVRGYVGDYDAMLLERHGSLTLGANLYVALMRLEWIEQAAKIMLTAHTILGRTPDDLPADRIAQIRALRGR